MGDRVLLIDASIYVIRAWQARTGGAVRDAQGHPAEAVHGFARFLRQLLAVERPERVAVAFDGPESAAPRRSIEPAYKADRPTAPPELRRQFAGCRALTAQVGLATFAPARVEADDVLATLAGHARAHGLRHTVVTGDKDLAQVVRSGDRWWDFERGHKHGPAEVRRRWGVMPHQIPDLLALAGDPSDNIPGIRGIGPATAARLLASWGDLDTLLAHTADVARMRHRGAGRTASRLAADGDAARWARRLTGTLTVPGLPERPDALAWEMRPMDRLASFLERLGLPPSERRDWRRLLGEMADTAPQGGPRG